MSANITRDNPITVIIRSLVGQVTTAYSETSDTLFAEPLPEDQASNVLIAPSSAEVARQETTRAERFAISREGIHAFYARPEMNAALEQALAVGEETIELPPVSGNHIVTLDEVDTLMQSVFAERARRGGR